MENAIGDEKGGKDVDGVMQVAKQDNDAEKYG